MFWSLLLSTWLMSLPALFTFNDFEFDFSIRERHIRIEEERSKQRSKQLELEDRSILLEETKVKFAENITNIQKNFQMMDFLTSHSSSNDRVVDLQLRPVWCNNNNFCSVPLTKTARQHYVLRSLTPLYIQFCQQQRCT